MPTETSTILSIKADKSDILRIRNKLGQFVTSLPKEAKRDSYNIAKTAGRTLKFSARTAGIRKWKGKLFNALDNPEKTGENSYSIKIPIYGFYLDKMSEHYVPRKPTMPEFSLWMWAEKKLGGMPRILKVHSHPWIENGLRKARVKVRKEFANGRIVRTTKKIIGG